jgi:hypothetical protein
MFHRFRSVFSEDINLSVESATLPLKKPRDYRAIIWGGLAAGILDITAACVNAAIRAGRSPLWVFQSVASGLLGADSYKGGVRTAALGLLIHFFIAFVACTVYFMASRKLDILRNRPVICGLLYGVMVYLFMYGIVLRLTFHRNFLTPAGAVITAVLIHMFCVGLPVSLAIYRFSKPSSWIKST